MATSAHTSPAPNHHAHHHGFSGVSGLLVGLTLIPGRGGVARLAADLTAVTDDDHVVDVGCGPGSAVRVAARRGATVTGIDPASVMLTLARRLTRGGGSIRWMDGAAEALPLPDGSATVLWSISTVHHWRDVDAGLSEAFRVLAPEGRLLAIERLVRPGATGHASHGWTDAQAQAFADRCTAAGFTDARADRHTVGRGALLVVQATRR
jgi:ubiquinone/menaquinone biosynthesis C-methylase UbiE